MPLVFSQIFSTWLQGQLWWTVWKVLPCFMLTVMHVKHAPRIRPPVPKLRCCSKVWCPVPESHLATQTDGGVNAAVNTKEMAADRKILLPFISQKDSSETKVLEKVLRYVTIKGGVPLENTTLFYFICPFSPSSLLFHSCSLGSNSQTECLYLCLRLCFLKNNLD